jgi:hypothetical protein
MFDSKCASISWITVVLNFTQLMLLIVAVPFIRLWVILCTDVTRMQCCYFTPYRQESFTDGSYFFQTSRNSSSRKADSCWFSGKCSELYWIQKSVIVFKNNVRMQCTIILIMFRVDATKCHLPWRHPCACCHFTHARFTSCDPFYRNLFSFSQLRNSPCLSDASTCVAYGRDDLHTLEVNSKLLEQNMHRGKCGAGRWFVVIKWRNCASEYSGMYGGGGGGSRTVCFAFMRISQCSWLTSFCL